ncbi:MAG: AsmA family protein [Pseudohongiellaceae bacterium]
MSNILKKLLKILLALAAALVVVVAVLLVVVDANRFRSSIEEAVADATGYEFSIAGDVEFRVFPLIGIELNDVRLRNPARPQELASFNRVVLRVGLGRLVGGRLLVREFRADGVHINYFVDDEGVSVWSLSGERGRRGGLSEGLGGLGNSNNSNNSNGDGMVSMEIERIVISDASIDYQASGGGIGRFSGAGDRFSIRDLNLEGRNLRFDGTDFPVSVSLTYLSDGMREPIALAFAARADLDLDGGTARMSDIAFSITPVLLEGNISVSDLHSTPRLEGQFNSNAFDLVGLLETLGLREPPREFIGGEAAREAVQLQVSLSGGNEEVEFASHATTTSGMSVESNGSVRFATEFSPLSISYDLAANALDLNAFLPAGNADDDVEQPASGGVNVSANQLATGTPLPLDMLSSLNVVGSVAIESVRLGEVQWDNINALTNLEGGVLDIELQPVGVYGGSVRGNLHLEGHGQEGRFEGRLSASVEGIDLARTIALALPITSITGRLTMESEYQASGATVEELLASLSGSSGFAVAESLVDITLVKQVFTTIAALSPVGDAIQQWPDQIRFGEFGGYLSLQDGIGAGQEMRLRMDNFDIAGSGGVDLAARRFDYDLLFTVLGEEHTQTIPINSRYYDVSWPVECSAGFDDMVSRYCQPDLGQVREIFAQIGRNEVQRRLDDVITDEVPDELQDAARRLLRGVFD